MHGSGIDAAIQALLQAQTTMMTSMSTSSSKVPDSHRPAFPDWDGLDSSKRLWLEKIECFKEAPFFSAVTDWSKKDTTSEAQSIWIRKELIQEDRIPPHIKATILNVPEFRSDGFKMLHHLLSLVRSTTVAAKMRAVRDLVALEQSSNEPDVVYMSRVRDIDQVVGNMKLSEILPLFALANLESSKYPGLLNRYVMNDPLITNASIRSLEREMVEEEGRLLTLQRNGQVPDLPSVLPAATLTPAQSSDPSKAPQAPPDNPIDNSNYKYPD